MTPDEAFAAANARALPAVARPGSKLTLPLAVVGVLALGGLTFAGLSKARTDAGQGSGLPVATATASAALPAPPVLTPVQVAPPAPPAPAIVVQPLPQPITPPVSQPIGRSNTPALIVDLTPPDSVRPADNGPVKADAAVDKLSPNESFAARVSRTAPDTVGTEKLSSTDLVIPQGTIITGVLETAINSDLPGLVRAVVSRDVRGFDTTKVLIPRGSRLIGQYSNGVALGQSRAFVIWTRLLRSDGVSIQLGSAATDPLGTAGLGGKVNSHFLRRFGAATLLSVITSGLDYLTNRSNNNTSVLIGSSTQANQLAGIALQRDIDIPPTIKIAQGTPVRVFVARDLDFGMTRTK